MKNVANTIEDLLEILAGLQGQSKIQIESSDTTIMYSIARQVFKGTALTDRQHEVMKEKLLKYKDQFTALEYDFDCAIETLRIPLRHIDRSKYIKIVNHSDMVGPNDVYESYKSDWKWIKIRFPFSKKLIVSLEGITKNLNEYYHEKGSHEHYFMLNENNTIGILDTFKDKEFNIEDALLDWYNKIKEIKNNKEKYVPGIYNYTLKNLNDQAVNYMLSSLGKPNVENLSLYKDRSSVLGLEHFDTNDLDVSINKLTSLSQKIVRRDDTHVLIKRSKYTMNNLCESLLELDRFPLLVVLPDNPLEDLYAFNKGISGFIKSSECSVLFRLDTHANYEFNNYIKENDLNSPLDKSLKVVYINNSKIPKPLLKTDWTPLTVILMSSMRSSSNVGTYINQANLVIHYDEEMSQFMRFQSHRIQEL